MADDDSRLPAFDEGAAEAPALDLPMLAAGRRIGGRYVLERPLGRGGMAAVWLATDTRLHRPVAIKVLSDTLAGDDGYLKRFAREARIAAGLGHPNLVAVYDFNASQRPYLVMEYIEGGDLAERLAVGETPDPEQLARELLAALRHIHRAGVLHRDIKPQNVLIDAHGHARLTDFGIAQPRDATSLTRTGNVIGTERYLAPEVLAGEPASERSDLYALGVVLDEVSGSASPALRELVDRLRSMNPDRRPSSAAAAEAARRRLAPQAATEATRPFAAQATQPQTPVQGVPARAPVPRPEPPPPAPPRVPAAASPAPGEAGSRRGRVLALGGLALLALALVVGLAIGIGGGEDDGGRQASAAPAAEEEKAPKPKEEAAPAVDAPAGDEEAAIAETADGAALDREGKDLLDSGNPEAAIPVLEQAVAALEKSGDELTYNYALYNLGDALVQAGRPEEAIPILEQRLDYPDQTDVVQAKLDEAYAAAGLATGSGKPKKPKKVE